MANPGAELPPPNLPMPTAAVPPSPPPVPMAPPPPPLPTPAPGPPLSAPPAPSTTGASGKKAPGVGSVAMNLLWLVFSGFWLFLAYLAAGVIQCITVIGIPFGIQSFKLAGFALWPFARSVVRRQGASTSLSLVGNVIWVVFSGFWIALVHLTTGIILCLTVVGIPLGLGNFKLIPLALAPFGKDIVRNGSIGDRETVSF